MCISRLAMDIRLYGTLSSLSSSSKSDQLEPPKSTSSSSDSDSDSCSECLDPKPSLPKKPRTTSHNRPKSSSLTSKRQCNKNGKIIFLGWSTVKIIKEHFVKCVKNEEFCFKELEEHGLLSHSITGRMQ